MHACFALNAAGVGIDAGHAPVVVVTAIPAVVDAMGFVYFLAPAGVDCYIEIGDIVASETEAVVDAVAIGREGVGDKHIGPSAGDADAADGQLAIPGASQAVGDGDAVDSEGVGGCGQGVGRGGTVEGVGMVPAVAGSIDMGGMQVSALGEEYECFVGPEVDMYQVGVADDDGGVEVGTAGGVAQQGDIGAVA